MTPVEALDKAIGRGGIDPFKGHLCPRGGGVPGEVIAGCDAETREALSRLTAADIAASKLSRYIAWLGYVEPAGKGLSKLKLEFDAKHWRRR